MGNDRLVLVLALSYGGRADIVQAAARMAQAVARAISRLTRLMNPSLPAPC